MHCIDHITPEERATYPERERQLTFSKHFGETPETCDECHEAWWSFEMKSYTSLMLEDAHLHDAACTVCKEWHAKNDVPEDIGNGPMSIRRAHAQHIAEVNAAKALRESTS